MLLRFHPLLTFQNDSLRLLSQSVPKAMVHIRRVNETLISMPDSRIEQLCERIESDLSVLEKEQRLSEKGITAIPNNESQVGDIFV